MNAEEARAQSAVYKMAYERSSAERQKDLFDDALKRLETHETFLAERDGQIMMYKDLTLRHQRQIEKLLEQSGKFIDVVYELTMRTRMGD